MIETTYVQGGNEMAQKKKNSPENEPKDKKNGKLFSKIILVILFLFYVVYSFKELF